MSKFTTFQNKSTICRQSTYILLGIIEHKDDFKQSFDLNIKSSGSDLPNNLYASLLYTCLWSHKAF
jgi:hypothetical protein